MFLILDKETSKSPIVFNSPGLRTNPLWLELSTNRAEALIQHYQGRFKMIIMINMISMIDLFAIIGNPRKTLQKKFDKDEKSLFHRQQT